MKMLFKTVLAGLLNTLIVLSYTFVARCSLELLVASNTTTGFLGLCLFCFSLIALGVAIGAMCTVGYVMMHALKQKKQNDEEMEVIE